MAKKRIPKLLVVFDTNVLYTQVASDLVRNEIQRIVQENSKHPDLIIEWYLPEIVVGERKYQMLLKAKELLPNLSKLERLIGHSFGVGEDTLGLHVDNAINNSIQKYNFKIAPCDVSQVNWSDLISRSVNREPPFEQSEKEKGFRDSIIAHSFAQLQNSSPTTPNVCRLVLVSGDQRLEEYVKELMNTAKNVRVLSKTDELESLINTLVSTVSEEFVAELSKKASKIFFEKENEKTFFYKENIRDKIKEQHADVLNDTILPDHIRSGGTWWLSEPIFIKKVRQRIYWVSTVEPEFEISHYEREEPQRNALYGLTDVSSPSLGIETTSPSSLGGLGGIGGVGSLGLLGSLGSSKKVIDIKGKEKFEVHWSTSLSQAQNLTSPNLEKIVYVGNNVGENNS